MSEPFYNILLRKFNVERGVHGYAFRLLAHQLRDGLVELTHTAFSRVVLDNFLHQLVANLELLRCHPMRLELLGD